MTKQKKRRKQTQKQNKKKMHRSKKTMTYHGRTGKPVIHYTEEEKKYIMVRKKSGGVKRLYLVKGNVPKKHRKR